MPAISPAINPQAIVGNRPKSTQSFQNFISGGNPLGTSVVSNAANKIVGFERASVKPVIPDINSIVNTISSNILNQVDNSIKSATNIINQTTDAKIQRVEGDTIREVQQLRTETQNNQITQLQTVIQRIQDQTTNVVEKLTENYKKKISDIDASGPNNLLTNFIQLYRTAIDFIKFFGDRKNIDTLRSNLVSLKESFTESFEVAKLIRTTILKIFNQLSNLPKAGPGSSSGLNIDVNVPKSGMKQTLPKSARGMKGKLGMLGLGLGGLAAGGAAVNALAGSRDQVEPVQTEQSIPGQILDTFSTLISRFANAVDEMVNGADSASSAPQGTPSSKSSQKGGGGQRGGGGSPGGLKPGAPTTAAGEFEDIHKQAAKIVQQRESAGAGLYNAMNQGTVPDKKGQAPRSGSSEGIIGKKLTDMTIGEVIAQQNKNLTNDKGFIHAAGAYQFIGNTLPGAMASAGLKPSDKFSEENQDLMFYAVLKDRGLSPWQADPRHKKYTQQEVAIIEKARRTPLKSKSSAPTTAQLTPPKEEPGVGGEDLPDWMLSPQKREELKLATQTVSQPPPSQTESPKITTLPLDLSGGTGGSQQKESGAFPAQISQGSPGPQVPYIPSSNPENFLVLYSKIVYNIVDG